MHPINGESEADDGEAGENSDEHGEDEEEPGSLKARLALRAQRNEYSDIED